MTSASREPMRSGLATLLEAALVGDGLPAQAVYDYRVADFDNQSPVVVVSSAGSERRLPGFGGSCWQTEALIQIDTFVLYGDGAGTWTESDAEDALDAIEVIIADVILANLATDDWSELTYEYPSETGAVAIGGIEYRRETITLRAVMIE